MDCTTGQWTVGVITGNTECVAIPTPYPTAYPTASPTKAPTAYPTAYPTASPTWAPTPLFNPDRHNQFCAAGWYYAPVKFTRRHTTYDVEEGRDESCHKCKRGFTSHGGLTPTCHAISNTWNVCSHLACKVTTDSGCNLARHESANPAVDLANGVDIDQKLFGATQCASGLSSSASKERLVVYHHGFENKGTIHKCALSGRSIDNGRICICACKDVDDAADFHAPTHLSMWDQEDGSLEHHTARSGSQDMHTDAIGSATDAYNADASEVPAHLLPDGGGPY
jgi:hypothetical protein